MKVTRRKSIWDEDEDDDDEEESVGKEEEEEEGEEDIASNDWRGKSNSLLKGARSNSSTPDGGETCRSVRVQEGLGLGFGSRYRGDKGLCKRGGDGGEGGGGVYLESYTREARFLTGWEQHAVAQRQP